MQSKGFRHLLQGQGGRTKVTCESCVCSIYPEPFSDNEDISNTFPQPYENVQSECYRQSPCFTIKVIEVKGHMYKLCVCSHISWTSALSLKIFHTHVQFNVTTYGARFQSASYKVAFIGGGQRSHIQIGVFLIVPVLYRGHLISCDFYTLPLATKNESENCCLMKSSASYFC